MGSTGTVAAVAVGAVLLAIWLELRSPLPSLRTALVHTAVAFCVLQALPPALKALELDAATPMRIVAALFLVVLPAFVYGFFALCRLLRVLAVLRAVR